MISPGGRSTVGWGLTGKAVPDVVREFFEGFVALFELLADGRMVLDAGKRWVLGPEDGCINIFLR